MAMIFPVARLTAINISMKQGEITITAKVVLNGDNFAKMEALRPYLDAKVGGLTIEIKPMQRELDLRQPSESETPQPALELRETSESEDKL